MAIEAEIIILRLFSQPDAGCRMKVVATGTILAIMRRINGIHHPGAYY